MKSLAALILLSIVVTADPPKGMTVIKPQGGGSTSPEVKPVDPPGKIVIRPQAPGVKPVITTPAPVTPVTSVSAGPTPDPIPVDDPRPTPPKPKEEPFDPEKGKILAETWDVAFVKGMKIGHFHVVVREYVRDGKTYIYAVKSQQITIRRFGNLVTTSAEDATLESKEGNVLVVRMSQEVSTGQKIVITGQVDGPILRTKAQGVLQGQDTVPWPEGVVGVSKERTLYADKKPKPGDTFDYNTYLGQINRVVKVNVKCLAQEMVSLTRGEPEKAYLKCEAKMEPIGDFKLPPAIVWVDAATFEPVRMDQDMAGLGGKMVLMRTTKEVALRPVGEVPDLFDVQSVRLDKTIPNIHDLSAVIWKISMPNEEKPITMFAASKFDDRQGVTITEKDPKTVMLKILGMKKVSVVPQKTDGKPLKPPEELFLGTSFFIDWDNDVTKKQAALIKATLPMNATPIDIGKAVEKWVNQNMKAVNFSQALAPTSEVSKNLSGDCTEYSMLAVGLCRALGVPAHTAIGLVYAAPDGKPVLAYHMWFEVWHNDHWVPLDATLAKGGIGPGHLKITDAHWHKEASFVPLLPVLRVLNAQPKIEAAGIEP